MNISTFFMKVNTFFMNMGTFLMKVSTQSTDFLLCFMRLQAR